MTIFADLSNEEYQRTYLGTRITRTPAVITDSEEAPVSAPTSVDWRLKNAVTPIKNQGQCMLPFSLTTLPLSHYPQYYPSLLSLPTLPPYSPSLLSLPTHSNLSHQAVTAGPSPLLAP